MQHATHNTQHTTRNKQQATHNKPPAEQHGGTEEPTTTQQQGELHKENCTSEIMRQKLELDLLNGDLA